MTLAVVILNWNGKALLQQFLPSVVNYSAEAHIYVADNASTDNSVAFLKENYPQVNLILNKTNGGYAKGYNEALKNLKEDCFILLNSDVEVSENWLPPILRIFEQEPQTVAVQPKLLDYKNKAYFEYAGAAGGVIDKFGYPFCRGRIFETLEKDQGQYDNDEYIFWASGACLAIRREAFLEAGKLDENFFAHQEEIDLCWRLFNLDYKIKFCASSEVYHLGGATLNKMNPTKTFFNFRNNLFLLLKNLPSTSLLIILFSRMILDAVAALRFLFAGKFSHFGAIFKAHISFYRNLRTIYNSRSKNRKKRHYFKIKSVILSYFVQRKKKYSNL